MKFIGAHLIGLRAEQSYKTTGILRLYFLTGSVYMSTSWYADSHSVGMGQHLELHISYILVLEIYRNLPSSQCNGESKFKASFW